MNLSKNIFFKRLLKGFILSSSILILTILFFNYMLLNLNYIVLFTCAIICSVVYAFTGEIWS
ncbi:hypothetical protein [Clostridium sardiniense]|uniref:hypothetical protein n=1 Tax=Clostridium sardiniense TaxID=29369 RepID=UPI001957F593|nr:hypothetical protein [Clostridium sardiniense]MBM7835505.1 hypothetical protein [Clostridium sardiniense]